MAAVLFAAAALAQEPAVEVEVAKPKKAKTEGTTVVDVVAPGISVRDLIAAGRLQEALDRLDQQLKVNPADDEMRVQRARILYWKGRHADALLEAESVLLRHPADLEVLELCAQIHLAMGDLNKSLEYYMGLQAVGDNRPEIQQRVLAILLELEDVTGLDAALARGGSLDDEQQIHLAQIAHPWTADVVAGSTWHDLQLWARLDSSLGRRLSRNSTLVGGALVEQRPFGTAFSPKLEFYGKQGRFSGMAHVSGSPSRSFLPAFDARADASLALNEHVSAGLWLRFATYMPADATAVSSLTIGPNLPISSGKFTITLGYVAVILFPGDVAHSAMLKLRYQHNPFIALFTWLYAGDDPNFIDRQSSKPAKGITALVGLEHWFTPRFGMRLSATRIQPFGAFEPFTEVAFGLRGRL